MPKLAQWHSREMAIKICIESHSTFMFVESKTSSREFHLGQNQVQGGQGFHFNPRTKKTTRSSSIKGVQFHWKPADWQYWCIPLSWILDYWLIILIVSTVIPSHLKNKLCDQQKFLILTRFIHHDNSSTVHYEGWILNIIARGEKLNVCYKWTPSLSFRHSSVSV